jgi:hypothetical protein
MTFSCKNAHKKTTGNQSISSVTRTWTDTILADYIKNTNNKLIRLALKDTFPEEWLFDRLENWDTTIYLVFHIGHDFLDKGNMNKRFITDGWVYIDSFSRKLYEYDLPKDTLIEWKK